MPQLQSLLDWLSALPPATLLAAMAALAAVENIFPPIPADVLVAFGGFLAARNHVSPWPAFLAVWLGNVAGALAMYAAGRRLGRAWIAKRFHVAPGGRNEARLAAWQARYGPIAFFVTRFLPGVRALVPPMSGALHVPVTGLAIAIAAASALWYGTITWLAFTAGNNWEVLAEQIGRLGWWSAVLAGAVVLSLLAAWWLVRRRAGPREEP
ncbi:MAG: DedA family protein [Gemmatimonadetes bacterium]|nr:DedA family protein [Gemmatimonadota bacterium]MBK6456517.1 DedA family protein [Gemmatimonadota bacterium]MBK9407094.1 DedA family protein [Gemmatimonadota bacterium]